VNKEPDPVAFLDEEQELIMAGKMETAPIAKLLCMDVFKNDLLVAIKRISIKVTEIEI
jgi:hypothetical protein